MHYGLTGKYGLVAADANYVTSHKLVLNSCLLTPPGTKFHFAVKSTDSSGNAAASTDKAFAAKSASLIVKVVDQHKGSITGAKVTVGDQSAVTDDNGQALLNSLPPVCKSAVTIVYKGKTTKTNFTLTPDSQGVLPSSVTLTAQRSSTNPLVIVVPLVIVLALVAWVVSKRGGGNDGGIKDLRTPGGPPSGSGGSAGPSTTPPSSSGAPTPTVVRPTIPPRT